MEKPTGRAAYQRSRREYLRFNRRCTLCETRDERTEAGCWRCEGCRTKHNEHARRKSEQLRSAGCCVRCGRKDERTESGGGWCAECNKTHTEYMREYRKRKREEKELPGDPALEGEA